MITLGDRSTQTLIILAAVGAGAWYLHRNRAALNPANPDNVVNRQVTRVVQGATGDSNQTLGGFLFDLFNPNPGDINRVYTRDDFPELRTSTPPIRPSDGQSIGDFLQG